MSQLTRMAPKVLKALAWTLAALVALILLLYLILLAINWRDEPPSPETNQLEQRFRNRPAVADEQNGFVYAMGFEVAKDQDPFEAGRARIAWMENTDLAELSDADSDPIKKLAVERRLDPTIDQFIKACRPDAPRCTEAFEADNPAFDRWRSSEQWLLQRYQALLERTGWREAEFDAASPLPRFTYIRDAQWLLMLEAKRRAGQGDAHGVRQLLEADVRFWRMALASSDILITRMLAARFLMRHFEAGSVVLKRVRAEHQTIAMPSEWRVPLSQSERSMLRVMTGEWTFSSKMLRRWKRDFALRNIEGPFDIDDPPPVWRKLLEPLVAPLYKPQATINDYARYYLVTARRLDAPLTEYEVAIRETKARSDEMAHESLPPSSAYNIVGKMMLGIGGYDFSSYAARGADIEGIRRAALAAVTLREAKVEREKVAAELKLLPAALKNPYNGKAFEWNAADGVIVFRGLEVQPRGTHRIAY